MARYYKRGREIRKFLLQSIPKHPQDVANQAVKHFGISRQAVSRYIQELLAEGYISAKGNTRQRTYSLRVIASEEEDYGFTKTVLPVRLVKHGLENLVSRSQAKRLLGGIDKLKTVVLDFQDTDSIGQAFADEVFRVFERSHPSTLLIPINTVESVEKMISLAKRRE